MSKFSHRNTCKQWRRVNKSFTFHSTHSVISETSLPRQSTALVVTTKNRITHVPKTHIKRALARTNIQLQNLGLVAFYDTQPGNYSDDNSKARHGVVKCELGQVQLTLRPTQIGTPMMMAGTAIAAMRLMPTGAPTNVPNCHRIFFLRLQGFLPQNVQPDGLHQTATETWTTRSQSTVQQH